MLLRSSLPVKVWKDNILEVALTGIFYSGELEDWWHYCNAALYSGIYHLCVTEIKRY